MPSGDYLPFLDTLGWLAALALAALLPSLPGVPGRSHAVWLIAFCATRLLVEAQGLVFTGAGAGGSGHDGRQIVAILGCMLLWEFARRIWNEPGARRIPASLHLVAAECIALLVAVNPSSGSGGRPAWFAPVEVCASLLPAGLAGAAAFMLWRRAGDAGQSRYRDALRVAAVGLGLHPALNGVPGLSGLGVLPPWIVVAGLGAACFALPAARTRAALACGVGLIATALLGPLAVAFSLERIEATEQIDLLARGQRAAGQVPRSAIARLPSEPTLSPDLGRTLRRLESAVRESDALLHGVSLWQLRQNRIWIFDGRRGETGQFTDARPATPDEQVGEAMTRAFLIRPTDGKPCVTVHAPLRASHFDNPAAWIALEYPDAFWAVQRRNARRSGVALVCLLAGFCAMGFVLASRQAIENAQRVAIERAQSADKAKTEFLAFLSHEMRTPLQTILGRTELLQRESNATDSSRRHGAAIETQGRLLLRLVTDLLDLGTLEAGKFQLRPHPFSLRQALAAVEDTIRAPAAAKQLAFTLDVAPGVPDALIGDEARLRQILGNILGNAVKYTRAGSVTLRVTRDTLGPDFQLSALNSQLVERLRFDVTDTGPGLPPDKIPQLFTLFTRLDSGDTFTREGTGVGLALVRRLCELMGGTATAANRPEGGAAFTVHLTFPVDAAAADEAGAVATGDPARPHGLRVLVAEDNAAAREFLLEAVRSLGHRAEGAADGPTALTAATTQRFDAVLLDVNLPGRDGVSIAAALAREPDRPRLIGCSAEAFAHTRAAALAAGMDEFLEKPVTLSSLAGALGAGPAAPVAGDNLFTRLQGPAVAARTRALLVSEWPHRHAAAAAALAQGDVAPVRALLHYVQSSARLAADDILLALCRPFDTGDATIDARAARDRLAALDQHVRGFAPRS